MSGSTRKGYGAFTVDCDDLTTGKRPKESTLVLSWALQAFEFLFSITIGDFWLPGIGYNA